MLATLFTKLGWTRDDAKWTWAIVSAVIVGIAAAVTDANTAAYYGLPAAILPYLRLSALIVGILAGVMKTSGLPGKP